MISYRNNRGGLCIVLGVLVWVQPLLGMKGAEAKGKDSLFTGDRACATQEHEDRAKERIKNRLQTEDLIAWSLLSVIAPVAYVGLSLGKPWSWRGLCVIEGATALAFAALLRYEDAEKQLLDQARVFKESEVQLDRSLIDKADNLHLHTISGNSFRALNEAGRSRGEVLFDGSYYQEYQEALIAGVQDYFAQCAQLNINESWKNRNKLRIHCVRLKKMGNKALELKHRLPRDVCDLILDHAGFARYKASDWPGNRELTERDILKLSGGHAPNHIIRIGSGRSMRINYMDDLISGIITSYKRYAFLEERGWIRFVDAKGPEPSFSPCYVLGMRMPIAHWEIYHNLGGTHILRFTTPDPEFFAQFYAFERDPAYASVVTRLRNEKGFEQMSQKKRRLKICNEVFKK